MTAYEHVMLGGTLGLAAGLHKRYGWNVIALAGVAAALPDWDGLSILFGSEAYARAHRVWGHNLLVASGLGAAIGILEQQTGIFRRICRALSVKRASLAPAQRAPVEAPPAAVPSLTICVTAGFLASYSHLAADLVYSYGEGQPWPLPLLWPFSSRSWVIPILRWGDLGATLIFIVEMFALYRWPSRAQSIAWLTLTAVVAYVGARWCISAF
jgi:membrane-bound metal-dependent hydrolase YbcI (DUF457 family)